MIRTHTELSSFKTLEERFRYLRLDGQIGVDTFGFDRWMNQAFYRSREWRDVRDLVIIRDNGLDLGALDGPPLNAYLVHHMNPLTPRDIEEASDNLLNPEFLITTSIRTHNAIHFADETLLPQPFVDRRPGDTKLW